MRKIIYPIKIRVGKALKTLSTSFHDQHAYQVATVHLLPNHSLLMGRESSFQNPCHLTLFWYNSNDYTVKKKKAQESKDY